MFIGFILLKVVISLKCTTFNNDTLEIYATQDEIIKMSFSEIFTSKDYSNITIENGLGLLSIISPIQLLEEKLFDSQNMKSFGLLTNDLSYEWLNKFAVLINTNNQYIIQLSLINNQGQNGRLPAFTTVSKEINVDVCFDLVFISKQIIAVDCMNTETNGGIQNIYYFWNDAHQNFTTVENDNFKGYQQDIKRKSLSANQQIYRATLYDINHSEFNSLLEVFTVDGKLTHYLDSDELTNLLKQEYQLQILDFRVSNLGQVAILNQNNDILVVNYSIREKIWKILHRFDHQMQVIAFDFNFKAGTYLLYYGNILLYQSKTNQFQYQISSISKVYLTNQKIIAQNNNIIFLFDQELNLIKTEQLDNIAFVVNDHTKDDLILFSLEKIFRFFLFQDYFLKYQNLDVDTDQKVSKIKQTQTNQVVCELIIYHSTIATNNEVLFLSTRNEKIISENIPTYPANYSLKFNKYSVYGTNLKYYFTTINNTAENLQITPKILENYSIEQNKTLQLLYSWFLYSETEIFLIIQYTTNLLEVQTCTFEFECKVQLETNLDFPLNEQNSCFWVGSKGLFIAFYENNLIQINFLRNSTLNLLFEIPYEFQVDQLIYNGIFLVFSQAQKIITAYYISTVGYLKQYSLNSETVSDLGIFVWQPIQVYSIYPSSHIYIINENKTEILIISCTLLEYKIIDKLSFSKSIDGVFAFKNSFLVQFSQELLLYDSIDEANIHYSKALPLFGYQIKKILSHSSQGWIYLETDQQKLLVMNINKLNINSLWCSILLNNSNIISSSWNYLFLNNQIIQFYHEVQLLSSAEIYSTNFLNQIQLQVQISNLKNEYFVNFNQTIQNQQTQIRFDENKLNLDKVLDQKSQENYCQKLSNEFIQNTVNKLELSCPDCGKEITLIDNIQFRNDSSINGGLDFRYIGQNKLIVLEAENFLIFANTQQLIQNVSFADKNLKCTNIFFADSFMILLRCQENNTEQILVQWIQKNNQFNFGGSMIISPDLKSIELIDNELFLISSNTVLLYHSEKSYPPLNDYIQIEKWTIDGTILKIYKISIFFHLYYLDQQLSIIEFQVVSGVVIQIQTFEVDLNDLINRQGYNSHYKNWLKIFITNQSQNVNLFYADYLFVAEAGVHFGINFVFNCTTQCKLEQNNVIYIIQNYGDWNAIDSKQSQSWLGVLYQQGKNQILSIYQIPQNSKYYQNAVTQIGGISYNITQYIQFDFISQNNQVQIIHYSQVMLATNNNAVWNQFSLNTERQICMNGKIEKQSILMIATNDFSEAKVEFKIDIKYNYYKFWGLWLFIAVIIIGITIGIWCWRKRKNAKTQISLLG